MRNRQTMATALATCLALSSSLSAQVVVTESATTTVNGKPTQSQIVYSIKGGLFRAHRNRADDQSPTGKIRIYDAAAARLVILDREKKEATIYDAVKAAAEVEKKLPVQRITGELTPTRNTKTLLGVTCEEYAFVLKAPITDDVLIVRSGTAWVARQGAGVDDYLAFFRAADTVLTASSVDTPSAALAIDRTETELYRRVAALGGIPYAIDMKLDVEGRGLTASLMRKAVTASRVVTTTSVETTPIGDELFAIPAGWTTRQK